MNALDFSGTGSVVINDDIPALGNKFTIDLWVKLNSLNQTRFATIFMRGTAYSANGIHIYDNQLAVRRNTTSNAGTILENINALSIDRWYRLTLTYDGSTLVYYRDGNLIKQVVMTGTFPTTSNISIGDWSGDYGTELNGSVHDFKIFNRALSNDEVLELTSNMSYDNPFNDDLIYQIKLDGSETNITKYGTINNTSFDLYPNNRIMILTDSGYMTYDSTNGVWLSVNEPLDNDQWNVNGLRSINRDMLLHLTQQDIVGKIVVKNIDK